MRFPADLISGAIVPAVVTLLIVPSNPAAVCLITVATAASGVAVSLALAKKLSGHTGDTYGCVVELAEVIGLLITAVIIKQ
jgi:cobalamin synthase